jgi:hypothetical protein
VGSERAKLGAHLTPEQWLVASLADALNHLDHRLLEEIQQLAADHEARRRAILNELSALAGSIEVSAQARSVPKLIQAGVIFQ